MNIRVSNKNIFTQYQEANTKLQIGDSQTNSVITDSRQESEVCRKDTVVDFNFGKTGIYGENGDEKFTVEQLSDLLNSKPGTGNNMLYRMEITPEDDIKIKEAIKNWREETGALAEKNYNLIGNYENAAGPIYLDDEKVFLHHSFATKNSVFRTGFDEAASEYLKYLTQERIPRNEENDKNCQDRIKEYMEYAASEILSYFKLGQETKEEVKTLAGQLGNAAIEFGKQMASGDNNISHIETALDINGVSMKYTQLLGIQQTLAKYNEQGVRDSFGQGGKYNYCALGSNYDVTGYEQLGTMAAKVKKELDGFLPKELAETAKDVFQKRMDNLIDNNRGEEAIKRDKAAFLEGAQMLAKKVGNYRVYESVKNYVNDPHSYDYFRYKGSMFESAFNAAYKIEMQKNYV